ncbi:MAG: hypothetical protein JWQ40_2422, partial [Segetibacter sp.]|nr:hypothetical protein [Segetibacter sp.]
IDGRLGTRSTNVLLLDNVSSLRKPRQINWTIINHRGRPFMPLELTFKDADTILNDGTPNDLSFRISNTNKNVTGTDPHVHFNSDASEGPVSRIYIFFETGDNNAAQVLADADNVKGITVAIVDLNDKSVAVEQSKLFTFEDHSQDQNQLPAWVFIPSKDLCLLPHISSADSNQADSLVMTQAVHKGEERTSIDFTVKNIITDYITGRTRMYVRFENIPGYWDETFVLEIDKQPLVMKGDKVGIGTNAPASKLHIQVNNQALNLPLFLRNVNGTENAGNAIGLGFLNEQSGDWAKAAIVHERTGGYGIGSMKFLISNQADQTPVSLTATRMTIASSGNIGIGTSKPTTAKLVISGNSTEEGIDLASTDQYANLRVLRNSLSTIDKDMFIGYQSGTNSTLHLFSNNVETLTVTGGNVGIGTASPLSGFKLDVNGNISGDHITAGNISNSSKFGGNTPPTGSAPSLEVRTLQGEGWPDIVFHHESILTSHLSVQDGANRQFRLESSPGEAGTGLYVQGSVGIGTAAPSLKLEVRDDGAASMNWAGRMGLSNKTVDRQVFFGMYNGNAAIAAHNFALNEWKDLYINTVDPIGYSNVIMGGKVGIGTATPQVPLEVNAAGTAYCSEINDQVARMGYQWNAHRSNDYIGGLTDRGTSQSQGNISIHAHGGVLASHFYAYSDERIKTEIQDVDSSANLSLINNLRVTDYNYKDYLANGLQRKRGLVAQEVTQVFPQVVSQKPGFIPDIFSMAERTTINNDCLLVALKEKHQLLTDDIVRLYTTDNKYRDVEVNVMDEFSFTVADWKESPQNLFVYGKYTDDIHVLDYNEVFCTGISAIQELSKQVDELKGQMETQETKLKELQELVQLSLVNTN